MPNGSSAPPTWPRDATKETAAMCNSLGNSCVNTITPDGNKGPIRNPRTTMSTTETEAYGKIANRISTNTAMAKYSAVALRTPILSVNGPRTSRPIAMPAQKSEEHTSELQSHVNIV